MYAILNSNLRREEMRAKVSSNVIVYTEINKNYVKDYV